MDFIHHSLPRHSAQGSKRSRANSFVGDREARLSVIDEDGPTAPKPATHHRISSRGWAFGNPPRHSFEKPPPQYSFWDVTGPKGEKLTDVRNNKYIAQRGGWRRMCLIFFILLAVILALAIGLGVGLQKHHSKNPTPAASSTAAPPADHPTFPAGNFALNTFLEDVSTNCTSNASTWTCAPYHTYADSPSQSKATWNWIIDALNPSAPDNYTISTTDNVFNILFANASLELIDKGMQSERYHFSTPFVKVVAPPGAMNQRCNYNDSTLEADLYTKLKQVSSDTSYSSTVPPSPSRTATSFSGGQQLWPYAVEVTVSQQGGPDVPDCHKLTNGVLGPRLTQGIETKASTDLCSCFYKNSNL